MFLLYITTSRVCKFWDKLQCTEYAKTDKEKDLIVLLDSIKKNIKGLIL